MQAEDAPPARKRIRVWKNEYHARRTTQAVMLTLDPTDAEALRAAARACARSISGHVAHLVATSGDPKHMRPAADPIADASELASFLAAIPDEIVRVTNELRRQGGLVKSLFLRPESVAQAERHASECAAALRALTQASEVALPVIGRIEDQLAEVRAQLEAAVIRMARDR